MSHNSTTYEPQLPWIAAALLVMAPAWWSVWMQYDPALMPPDAWLPVLFAVPLVWWLGRRWPLRAQAAPAASWPLYMCAVLTACSVLAELPVLSALALVCLFYAWACRWLELSARDARWGLLFLVAQAVPWVSADAATLGWWFRLTGAEAAGAVLACGSLPVTVDGTLIMVGNQPIGVDTPCAGMQTLQALLIAGGAAAWLMLGQRRAAYLCALALLPLLAWVINTLRIVAIAWIAVHYGPEAAQGWLHDWGGWLVIVGMFAVALGCVRVARWALDRWAPQHT